MTDVLAARLSREGKDLVHTTSDLLHRSGIGGIADLALRLPSMDEPILKVVATGAYNAGKSSLLQALTGFDIDIDADVATTSVTAYPWHGVVLVDTPGVGAGREHLHDEAAERAVRDADLILFVLTGAFFDDETVQHFRHVLFDLHKLPQTLVVINKKSQRGVSDDICRAELERALGRGGERLPPFVRCDARDYLRSQEDTGPKAEARATGSGVHDVEDELNQLTRRAGTSGQLAKPFEAVLAAVGDALPLLEPSSEEGSLLDLLEQRRAILAESRVRLHDSLEGVLLHVRQRIASAGEGVIASITDGLPDSQAVTTFDGALRAAVEALPGRIQQEFEKEVVRLETEERALAASPDVDRLVEHYERLVPGSSRPRDTSPRVGDFWTLIEGPGRNWLTRVVQQGGRPGSPMHTAVLEVGHALGHTFRPWQAVRVASRINVAVTAGLSLYNVYSTWRQEGQLENQDAAAVAQMRARVLEAADGLVDEARRQLQPYVADFYSQLGASELELSRQLGQAQEDRSRLRSELDDVAGRCRTSLLELRQPPEWEAFGAR